MEGIRKQWSLGQDDEPVDRDAFSDGLVPCRSSGGKLTRPPIAVVRDAAFPSNAAQGAAMLVASVNKLGFVDDVRSTICRGQRFFALNVICLFLPAGWAKRRQSFGKRFVRGSTTLFACCIDKLIDQPGVEDHKFLFAPILTVDSQANEKPTF